MHILESASLCLFGALCVLPKLAISCELAIKRWRIEVVEAQVEDSVSQFIDMPTEVVTIVISDLLIELYFPVQLCAFEYEY